MLASPGIKEEACTLRCLNSTSNPPPPPPAPPPAPSFCSRAKGRGSGCRGLSASYREYGRLVSFPPEEEAKT